MRIQESVLSLYQRFMPVVLRREWLLHNKLRQRYKRNTSQGKISIITPTNKTIYRDRIFENYSRQDYTDKELIIILNNNQLDQNDWVNFSKKFENVSIYQLDESISLGECINYGFKQSRGDFIAKFDDDDYYGPNYLTDLAYCFLFTNAEVVGKASQFIYFQGLNKLIMYNFGKGYRYHVVWGGTHLIKRKVMERVSFESVNLAEDVYFNNECLKRGIKQYAADPFNYLRIRIPEKKYHTYKLEDREYAKFGIPITDIINPEEYVTI